MFTVLWSTPRTGSSWYSSYLYDELCAERKTTIFLRQYLNEFNMRSYWKSGDPDLLYNFEANAKYQEYFLEPLGKKITSKSIQEPRWRTLKQEELHRIDLLEKHNLKKYPIFVYQHISPMSVEAFSYLRNRATRNIFLYRENFIDQLSSYALAMHTKIFRKQGAGHNVPVLKDVTVDRQVLLNLTERIKHFHEIDKTGCELISYESIDFTKRKNTEKLNKVRPFDQLSSQTKLDILELKEEFDKKYNIT
jgi:hypothetical protein